MLSSETNDLLYLLNILEYIGKTWKYTKEARDAEGLYELNEQLNLNASLTLLANIGENVSRISDSLKQEYDDIEWQQIKDFRNRIIHDYVGIDLALVYGIITNDLVTLKQKIEKIIRIKIEAKIFNIEEIKVSIDSKYYMNIDFKNIS